MTFSGLDTSIVFSFFFVGRGEEEVGAGMVTSLSQWQKRNALRGQHEHQSYLSTLLSSAYSTQILL